LIYGSVTQPKGQSNRDLISTILHAGEIHQVDVAAAYVTAGGAHDLLELISKILSHENRETTELDEAQEVGGMILMSRQDTAKVLQPSEQPLDFPAALVTA
jgi:hypothetical protein